MMFGLDPLVIALIVALLLVYVIPIQIAIRRKHPHVWPIVITNTAAGWTGVGWIGVLVWSVMPIEQRQNKDPHHA